MKKPDQSCRNNCGQREKCIFQGLDDLAWENLTQQVVTYHYKKNQSIFIQGQLPHGIHCIHNGKVKVIMVNNEGKESIMRIATTGDILGHRALFAAEAYYSSATALEDVEVNFFSKELILPLLKVHPSISLQLLVQLSQNIGSAEVQNAILVHKNVRERLARLLLQLNDTYGMEVNEIYRLDIKLTREEMAAMIGTTHETLVRLMTEFKNEEIITQEGKILFIINKKKLKEFTNA